MAKQDIKQDVTNQIKKVIKEALGFYNGFYGEIVHKMRNGQFYTSLASADDVNKLCNRIELYHGDGLVKSYMSEGEVAIYNKLQLLASGGFDKSLVDAYSGIGNNGASIQLERAFCNGSFNDFELQSGVELLKLIDNEFSRQAKSLKSGAVTSSEVVGTIIGKALKSPSLYVNADMNKLLPYLQSSLTASECNQYIFQIKDIVDRYELAKTSMAEVSTESDLVQVEFYSYELEIDRDFKEYFHKHLPKDKMEKLVKDYDNFILQVVTNNIKTIPESLKGIRISDRIVTDDLVGRKGLSHDEIMQIIKSTKAEIVKRCKAEVELMDSVAKKLKRVMEMVSDYRIKDRESQSVIDQIVESRNNNGQNFFRGRIDANVKTLHLDDLSGETTEVEGEKEIKMTDNDLMNIIRHKLIKHSSAMLFVMKEQMKESTSMSEFAQAVDMGYNTIELWLAEFDGDIKKITDFYDTILATDSAISNLGVELRNALYGFMDNFNPRGKKSRMAYLSEEDLASLREYGKRSIDFEIKIRDAYYKEASRMFMCAVLNYFNQLKIDDIYFTQIEDHFNLKKISQGVTICDLLDKDVELHPMTIFEQVNKTIKALKDPKNARLDISTILSNEDIVRGIQSILPFLNYELSYGTLNNMIQSETAIKEKDLDSARQMALFISDSMESMEVSNVINADLNGLFTTSAFFEYLEQRLAMYYRTLTKIKNEQTRKQKIGLYVDQSLFEMISDAERMYNEWAEHLKNYLEKKDSLDENEASIDELLKAQDEQE